MVIGRTNFSHRFLRPRRCVFLAGRACCSLFPKRGSQGEKVHVLMTRSLPCMASGHAAQAALPGATATRSTGHASAPLATRVRGHWAPGLMTYLLPCLPVHIVDWFPLKWHHPSPRPRLRGISPRVLPEQRQRYPSLHQLGSSQVLRLPAADEGPGPPRHLPVLMEGGEELLRAVGRPPR